MERFKVSFPPSRFSNSLGCSFASSPFELSLISLENPSNSAQFLQSVLMLMRRCETTKKVDVGWVTKAITTVLFYDRTGNARPKWKRFPKKACRWRPSWTRWKPRRRKLENLSTRCLSKLCHVFVSHYPNYKYYQQYCDLYHRTTFNNFIGSGIRNVF